MPIASQRIDSKPAHDLIDFRLNPVKVVCFKNFLTASGLFKQRIVHFFGIFFIILRLSFLNFKQFFESTLQKSSDRQVVRRLGILVEIADSDAPLPFDPALVRQLGTRQNFDQGGFAGTILTDDSHVIFLVQSERGILIKLLVVKRHRQSLNF